MAHTIESLLAMVPKTLPGDKAKSVDTIVQLNVTGSEAGQWHATIKNGNVNVAKGVHTAPELTVTADTVDILAVANGELDAAKAFMAGKAKVKGDLTEVLGLVDLFKPS